MHQPPPPHIYSARMAPLSPPMNVRRGQRTRRRRGCRMCRRSSATKCRPSIRRPLSDRRSVQRPWACCFTAGGRPLTPRASGRPSPKSCIGPMRRRAVRSETYKCKSSQVKSSQYKSHVRSKSRRNLAKQIQIKRAAPPCVFCEFRWASLYLFRDAAVLPI